ncbi:hypothetical protein [uncultured Shewanella sp.]|uniref:hypothetical protein n=1 Tax=uncultured Shewanella sp. TaxID=173975 RepID=UPI00263061D0|nr:hypothetical protein [uncultured Shewanella sp.]
MGFMTSTSNLSSNQCREDVSLGHLLYGLLAAFPLLLIPALFSLIINMLQRESHMGDMLKSHLSWQRRSIFGLLFVLLIGYGFHPSWVSMLLYLFGTFWFTSRIVKGWLCLLDGRGI